MSSLSLAWLLTRLGLVAGVVWAASVVTRRYGHAAGGWLAGLPVIAGPITALLLVDLPQPVVRAVGLATLQCQPALMTYLVVFAHAAQRLGWPASMACAVAAYLVAGALLLQLDLGAAPAIALALLSPLLGLAAMPRAGRRAAGGPVGVPRVELALRIGVACAVAAGVMLGARHLSAAWAGLLLAAPISGLVLPAFTLPRHGPAATAALLAGFARGQAGFVVFFAVLVATLPLLPGAVSWLLSVVSAVGAGWALARRPRRGAG